MSWRLSYKATKGAFAERIRCTGWTVSRASITLSHYTR
jgi:hypothetical protein